MSESPLHGHNLIANRRVSGASTFRARSPLDGSTLEPAFQMAGEADVDAALAAADRAFESFRLTTGETRAALLDRIAAEIEALGDALVRRAHLETGLPEARILSERARTVAQLRLFAAAARDGSWVDARIDCALPDRQPLPRPDLRRMLMPVGPVVVFGSSNFPLAFSVAGGDTASALATGNTVVVKAHSGHPGTSELVGGAIARAVEASGLPPGVFSLLHGAGKVIGIALVRHPLTRAAGFTGSRAAGRALFDAAAARPDPIPVFAEMSSVNPVFILPEAMRDRGEQIADGLKNSVTLGVGQFCTKPGLVFGLGGESFEAFQTHFANRVAAVRPATMLHAGISESFESGLAHASAGEGVTVVARATEQADPGRTQAAAVAARTDAATFRARPDLAAEVFGPFALLIAAASMAELEDIARDLDGQLTATIHGTDRDLERAGRLVSLLERKAGRLIVNGFPTGVEVCAAMNHGGPYPATTDVRFTSVGTAALLRFVRPICYQGFPESLLPEPLRDDNPLDIKRLVTLE
jgi:NADP-dependent aldehyde dehydrogenase